MKKFLSVTAILTAMLWINSAALAEEVAVAPVTAEPVATTITAADTTTATATTTTTTSGNKFASRERLVATLLGELTKSGTTDDDATAPTDSATGSTGEAAGSTSSTTTTGTTAETISGTTTGTFSDASGEGQASQQDTGTETGPSVTPVATDTPPEGGGDSALASATGTDPAIGQGDVTAAGDSSNASLDAARVATFVANLSDEQVLALNRSLNNAVQQGLVINYDMDLLEKIVTEQYGKQRINALTKALEEEAKFLALYERTGNEKFQARAEAQKERFLAKVESMHREAARTTLRDEVKSGVAEASRSAAKEQIKSEARLMAKTAAAETAKGLAREAAKDLAKAEAKQLARNSAQEAAKDVAKQAAKEVAKEVTKENQRANARARRNNG